MIYVTKIRIKKGKLKALTFSLIILFNFSGSAIFAQAACHNTPVDGPFYEYDTGSTNIDTLKNKGVCYTLAPGTGTKTVCYRYTYPSSGNVTMKYAVQYSNGGCNNNTCTVLMSSPYNTAGCNSVTACSGGLITIKTYDNNCNFIMNSAGVGAGCPSGSFVSGQDYIVCFEVPLNATCATTVCPILSCSSGACGCPATITAAAGADQTLCGVTSTTLTGNNASPGIGTWTTISGPNTPTITSPNSASTTVTGLTTGTYTFRWSSVCGIVNGFDDVVVMVQPDLIPIISSNVPVTCKGSANGTLTTSVTGGVTPYAYSWAPIGGNSATASGLSGGTYTVTVTGGACTKTATATVLESSTLLKPSITSIVPVDCIGNSTGSLTASQTGGTSMFNYSWAPVGGNSATATGLSSGSYTVTITDAYGCVKTTSAAVVQSAAMLTPSIASNVPVTCTGSSTGSLTASQTGGTSAFNYSWAPTGGNSATATGLSAGSYTVTITDAYGCVKTTSATVVESSNLLTPSIVSNVPVTCTGSSTGTLTASQTGGTSAFNYSWTPVGGNSATAAGLSAGTYTVTITDAYGCVKTTSAAVVQSTALLVPSIASNVPVTCTGTSTGTLTASQTGGTSAFNYSWAPTGGNSATATGLTAGSYTVTITDAYGCVKTTSATVVESSNLLTPSIASNVPVTCTGSSTGTLTASQTGGTSAFNYTWAPTGGNSATATGLTAGTYTVTITDAYGCVKTTSATVVESSNLLTPSIASNVPVTCTGSSTGTLTASQTGGTSAFNYSWAPTGGNSATATGLTAGSYTVTITDAYGCVKTTSATVVESSNLLTPSIASNVPVTCTGSSTGTLTASQTGGTSAFNYTWAPTGGNSATATGLTAGTYTVTITDAYGCVKTTSATVVESSNLLTPSIASNVPVTCTGSSTGTLTASQTGGTSAFNYSWAPTGGNSATATGLTAGSYTVTITDAYGCVKTTSATVVESTVLLTPSVTSNVPVTCTGSSTGSLTVSQTGGTAAYTYSWSPSGGNSDTATGLTAGSYTVTITDAYGCVKTTSATVVESTALLTPLISGTVPVDCIGNSTGSLTASQTGGTGAFSYSWAPSGGNSMTATGLSAGSYTVTITDAYGCVKTTTGIITQPAAAVSAKISSTIATCNISNGTVSVTASGGTPGYFYSWIPGGQVTAKVVGLSTGTYTVVVRDTNGCTSIATATVSGLPKPLLKVSTVTNITCNGLKDGTAKLTVISGTAPYTYIWTPNAGASDSLSGLSANTYTVVVRDSASCKDTVEFTINEPLPLTFTLSTSNETVCAGESLTLLTTTPNGGRPPFTFNWLPVGPLVSPLVPTTYSVTVIDSSGCISEMDTIRVTPLAVPIAGFDTVSSGILNQKYNFLDQSTGAISWKWKFGDGSTSTLQNPSHIYPSAGIYKVTQIVKNSSGCSDTIIKIVTIHPDILIPNVFTPNNDGVNDEFYIPNTGFESFELIIYDRWGLKLFETNSGEIRWDGRTRAGQPVPDGTYFFFLHAVLKTEIGSKEYPVKGFVQLYRSGEK